MSRKTRLWRSAWLASAPPRAPGEQLTTAAGFFAHTLRPYGREPTSIAFLRTLGTERLYSGVTNSTASAIATRSRNIVHDAGGLLSSSKS